MANSTTSAGCPRPPNGVGEGELRRIWQLAGLVGVIRYSRLERTPSPYDGLWSVSLKVDQGSCGSREIEVLIRNGEISHAGDRGFFTAEGRVAERGESASRTTINSGTRESKV